MALTRFFAGVLDGLLFLIMHTLLRPIKRRQDEPREQQKPLS